MKAHLLYRDADFDMKRPPEPFEKDLVQDLELNALFDAMAAGDKYLREVIWKVVLSGLRDMDAIRYRQAILMDCLKHPAIVRSIYALTVETLEAGKKIEYWISGFGHSPAIILNTALNLLEMYEAMLKKLRTLVDLNANLFESEGFATLFATLKADLSDDYLSRLHAHLVELRFRRGVLISARLGGGNKGSDYVLRKSNAAKGNWLRRLFAKKAAAYSYTIPDRDESGAKAMSELHDRGVNLAANAAAQSANHILGFFTMLRLESAFYIGCLNLHEILVGKGLPIAFPVASDARRRRHSFRGLCDPCMALTMDLQVMGNDVNADDKELVIITGANQGGKSTFLRSIGLAQLMMQSGMFVIAERFAANISEGIFTHFRRKEDPTMESGKFDEELVRMSAIADELRPHSLVLFNESFAATNEREGSEIARQIASALIEKRIKIFFVTHQYEFAHGMHEKHLDNALFLLAERRPDGERTFKLAVGAPLATGYGEDLYKEIFEE
jgi:DNA mismatch repair ATPase MutS